MNKKTIYIIVGAVALAAIIGIAAIISLNSGGEAAKLLKNAINPTVGAVDDKVSETGLIATNAAYNVTSAVTGRVVICNIEEGAAVNKDDVLYVIDSTDLQNQIHQANLALEKARAAYNQSLKSKSDLNIAAAKGGSIKKLYIHSGDFISQGAKIADMADNSNMLLKVAFNATQASLINYGDTASIQLLKSGAQLDGIVEKKYDYVEGLSDGRAAVFVELRVHNPGAIMPNDSATAIINGIASMNEGVFENYSEYSVYAKQGGIVQTINFEEGKTIPSDSILAVIKNDAIENAIENADLQVKDCKSRISELNGKLGDYTIKAPVSAAVETLNIKQSEFAAPGTPLAVLSDVNAMCAQVEIDELYISKIHPGQFADIYADALDKKKYTGTVASIDNTGIAKNGVTYYKVKIWLDNLEGLKIGMNLNIDIYTGHKENALLVPTEYVQNGKVTVILEGKATSVDVTTGIKTDKYTEILGGLDKDSKIIVPDKATP